MNINKIYKDKQTNNIEVLSKKIEHNKKLKAKEKAKKIRLAKGVLIGLAFVILVSLLVNLIDMTVKFFRENTIIKYQVVKVQLHAPFEIINLAELQRRTEQDKVMEDISNKVIEEYLNPKGGMSEECKITSQINPKTFFDIIVVKESGNNTNDNPKALHNFCKAKGMYNGIGYSPSTKFCFKDEQEARLYVAYYVKKNCDGKSLEACQCFYNLGKWVEKCAYSEGNLSIAN